MGSGVIKNSDKQKRNNVQGENYSHLTLAYDLESNIAAFKEILSKNPTVQFRNFEIAIGMPRKCCLIFLSEMASRQIINDNILEPLMLYTINENIGSDEMLEFLSSKVIISNEIGISNNVDELISGILSGDSVLFVDGSSDGLIISSTDFKSRNVSEPLTEAVVRGPREGFTEDLKVNISLIRRKIKNVDLKFEFMYIGETTRTKVAICYLEETANKRILEELKKRLASIKIDGILDTGYIDELIKDNPLSPFKTVGSTERPDTLASKILEGRIAILCDGTPFALSVPFLFVEYFQASEDYYNSFIYGSFNRLIRILGFFLSSSIPAVYVAWVTFHQEMVPTPLFLSITAAREGVPFPTVIEALMMLLVFEIIREAGIRIPSGIGQAVSIVGALVLGDAAVTAKIISAPIVIITSITGIGSFLLSKMLAPLMLIRILLIIFASTLGLFGYIFGIIFVFIHLVSIESFGVPYMSNINSLNKEELQDCAIRAPWWYMYYLPIFVADKNKGPVEKNG